MRVLNEGDKKDGLMTWDDEFSFSCHLGIDCFNSCCRDVTIFLSPIDVVSLRKALGITSTEFLERYVSRLTSELTGVPAAVLRMNEEEDRKCFFVSDQGCTVYESRPYSCRMYPLDTENGVEYSLIVDSSTCHGLRESNTWTVERWRKDQGLYRYDDLDHNLKDVIRVEEVWEEKIADSRMQDMMFMALYDVDRFRRFIFESSFLEKFEIDEDILEKIREDDIAMVYFAAQWLRFSLYGKKEFLEINPEYLERKKKEVLGSGG